MDFTEARQDRLRSEPEGRRSSGVPGGTGVGEDLEVGDRRASRIEKRERFRLRVEGIEKLRLAVLPAARRFLACQDEGSSRPFGVGKIAAPDFEQPNARRAAVHVAARGCDQAGQERWTHHLHLFADRIVDPPGGAERGGFFFGNEAPGQGFVESPRRGGTPHSALDKLRTGGGRLGYTRRPVERD